MEPFALRWPLGRRRVRPVRGVTSRAARSSPSADPGPPPLRPSEPEPALPDSSLQPLSPLHQKLALYAGGALVVLIVLIIIFQASAPTRQILDYVPKGQSNVQVIDLRRFTRGPVYGALSAADHPIKRHLEEIQNKFNVDFARDVAFAADADGSTILIGHFHLGRLRDKLGDDADRPRYVATVRGVGYRAARP